MGKLIKYELKKQRTTRMVILVGLAAGLIAYTAGILFDLENVMLISLGLIAIMAWPVLFYVGIESILIFNQDLRTKQSYMLWMVPKSIWEILGAKFISAILQILIVFVMYAAAAAVAGFVTIVRFSDFQTVLESFGELTVMFGESGISLTDMIWFLVYVFLLWTIAVMIGFLAVILSRTVLLRSRFAGFFAAVLFVLINMAVGWLYSMMMYILSGVVDMSASPLWNMLDVAFYLLASAALFGISGWIAQRKLSV